MGILKVGVGAAQGVLADSWREYFYCDAMDVDVLAKKGEQRQSKRGFNTKKSENIISNGSIIVINEGQCMMIVEQGKVVEVCAEAGEFLYDSATEPSLFYGDLKESIKESFRQFGKRVGFGGDPAGDQRSTISIQRKSLGINTAPQILCRSVWLIRISVWILILQFAVMANMRIISSTLFFSIRTSAAILRIHIPETAWNLS